MVYRVLAELVVLVHLAFIIFTVIGGFLLLQWRRIVWLHLPAALWSALNQFFNWVCPLTPLENLLRGKGGIGGYQTGFIEHYILPLIYPAVLTRNLQLALGVFVVTFNMGVYLYIFRRPVKAVECA